MLTCSGVKQDFTVVTVNPAIAGVEVIDIF